MYICMYINVYIYSYTKGINIDNVKYNLIINYSAG